MEILIHGAFVVIAANVLYTILTKVLRKKADKSIGGPSETKKSSNSN